MAKSICIINGHPDASADHLIPALCDAYTMGATSAGHSVQRINVSEVHAMPLRTAVEFQTAPDDGIQQARSKIEKAQHVFLAFPLWLGSMPSATRAFFEQAARGDFFLSTGGDAHRWPKRLMKGKSAHVLITMGMPGFAYKVIWGAASLKAVERGLLGISGFKPVRHTVIGGVGEASPQRTAAWFADMHQLGILAK